MSFGRNNRACMVCSIVQSYKQFLNQGCPNCEEILQLRGSAEAINECTSQQFEGVITMGDPKTSWVAKWLRLTEYVPSVYALKVSGTLPEGVVDALEEQGIHYVPRDGSEPDAARD